MGIVFSQLAVASHACPELTPSAAIKQMKAMDDMAGMPCADAGMAEKVQQPALCAQHCDQGNQTVGAAQPTDFHPALVLLLVLQVPHNRGLTWPFERSGAAACTRRIIPPLWRTGRLRI